MAGLVKLAFSGLCNLERKQKESSMTFGALTPVPAWNLEWEVEGRWDGETCALRRAEAAISAGSTGEDIQ